DFTARAGAANNPRNESPVARILSFSQKFYFWRWMNCRYRVRTNSALRRGRIKSTKQNDRMIRSNQLVLNDATEWLGDYHPLAEQLGSADGLVELSSVAALLQLRPVCDIESLRAFIEEYQVRILLPFELPAIERAHGHASRNELRELVAFDQEQSVEPMLQNFAGASRRVG